MTCIKQNWIKVSLGVFVLIALFYFLDKKDTHQNTATINDAIQTPTDTPEKDPRIIALEQSLPRFEDYPAKVYSIPPKPLLVHESNPYGMRFWTLTENWIEQATEYNMGGHYLMGRYGTGNPDVLIIDGLTGKIFHESGSLYPSSVASSSLVIFDPIELDCFSSGGDYQSEGNYKTCYAGEQNPRYALWDGKQFVTICKPIIKAWKLVSCGEVADKK